MVVAARSKLMHGSYGEEIIEAFVVEEGILLASEMELQNNYQVRLPHGS